jgi:lipopolysaccharide export system protein LptC
MNGRSTIIFPLIVLGVLALITFWIESTVQSDTKKNDGSHRHDVDYFVDNFVTTKTDVNGNLRNMLAAVEMRHYPDNDTTELVRPRYTQFGENKPYTQIEAQTGFVSPNGETVEFKGNVIVVRQAFEGRGEMRLKTDYLKVLPKTEYASTESDVLITQDPKTVIHGTGMVYDKANQDFTLKQRVRVHYEKPITKSARPLLPKTSTSDKVNPTETNNKIARKNKLSDVKQPSNPSRKTKRELQKN